MWSMAQNSMMLFFQGKLFKDPGMAFGRLAIGIAIAAIVFVGLAKLAGLPLWAAALVAGFGGGLLQPILFKDLRYR